MTSRPKPKRRQLASECRCKCYFAASDETSVCLCGHDDDEHSILYGDCFGVIEPRPSQHRSKAKK